MRSTLLVLAIGVGVGLGGLGLAHDDEHAKGKPTVKVKGATIYSETVSALYVAGFQSPRYTILVVSGQSRERSLHFAVNAANAILSTVQGSLRVPMRGMKPKRSLKTAA